MVVLLGCTGIPSSVTVEECGVVGALAGTWPCLCAVVPYAVDVMSHVSEA